MSGFYVTESDRHHDHVERQREKSDPLGIRLLEKQEQRERDESVAELDKLKRDQEKRRERIEQIIRPPLERRDAERKDGIADGKKKEALVKRGFHDEP